MSVQARNLNGEQKSHMLAPFEEMCARRKQWQPASKIWICATNVDQHVIHTASTKAWQKHQINKGLLDHEIKLTLHRDSTFGESARSMARKNARS